MLNHPRGADPVPPDQEASAPFFFWFDSDLEYCGLAIPTHWQKATRTRHDRIAIRDKAPALRWKLKSQLQSTPIVRVEEDIQLACLHEPKLRQAPGRGQDRFPRASRRPAEQATRLFVGCVLAFAKLR